MNNEGLELMADILRRKRLGGPDNQSTHLKSDIDYESQKIRKHLNDNFTPIPHGLLEFIASSKIFSEKTRIFSVILRKTYGWNKEFDWISLSQFEEMTGIKKPNVTRALKKLISSGVVVKEGKKYSIPPFQKDWLFWGSD